jgi:predicted aldo/keto reductase-like oxidoreductase
LDFNRKRNLGRTGLKVGPLGVAGGYGAPAEAFEEAFERGCNYFYWASMRRKGMRRAIREFCRRGKREDLVIVLQSYSRSAFLMERFLVKGLRSLKIEYADVLILGWHNKLPASRLLDTALSMQEKGYFRYLGLSGHNRSLFPELARDGFFDLFHIRYSAAHRGAETETFPYLNRETEPGVVTYTATRWGQLLKAKKTPPGISPLSASNCYRFALTNPVVDACLCGPKNREQMREALRTLELGPLSAEELERVRKIGDYVHQHAGPFF